MLQIKYNMLGDEHLNVAETSKELGRLYYKTGNYSKAAEYFKKALEIRHKILGENHLDYAISLSDLASVYFMIGRYNDAEMLYLKAQPIYLNAVGDKHLYFADLLKGLAMIYQKKHEHPKAEEYFLKVLDIMRNIYGDKSKEIIGSLTNLARFYKEIMQFDKAELYFAQVLEIKRLLVGENSSEFAVSLNNLAEIYMNKGSYDKAESLSLQAKEILRTTVGDNHIDYAFCLGNLAILYLVKGDYDKAETLSIKALDICQTTLGDKHPYVPHAIANLAIVYKGMKFYDKAERLLLKAIHIQESITGERHLDSIKYWESLAALYLAMGDYGAAEGLLAKSLESQRMFLGENHPDNALIQADIALVYCYKGDYTHAESLLREAITSLQKVRGENYLPLAGYLSTLAFIHKAKGDYQTTESLLLKVMDIHRRLGRENNLHYVDSIVSLAELYVVSKRINEAIDIMKKAFVIENRCIDTLFSMSSDSNRMDYLMAIQVNFQIFLSIILEHLYNSKEATIEAMDLVLCRKAIDSEATKFRNIAISSGKYESMASKSEELNTIRMQIAQEEIASAFNVKRTGEHHHFLQELDLRKETLEAELSRQMPEIRITEKLEAVNYKAILNFIDKGSVIIEFLRINIFNFHAVDIQNLWKPAHYVAFILRPDGKDNVYMFNLGEAEPIDKMIKEFKMSTIDEIRKGDNRHLSVLQYNNNSSSNIDIRNNIGHSLRSAIFDPLISSLGDCKRLFIAPDGDINLIPFEILPTDEYNRRLIEDYHITYLTTGREVLDFAKKHSTSYNEPIVISDPDFDLHQDSPKTTNIIDIRTLNVRHSRDLNANVIHFERLAGTRRGYSYSRNIRSLDHIWDLKY